MSDSKRQSLIMTGIGLIFVSFVLLYFALSQPRLSESEAVSLQNETSVSEISVIDESRSIDYTSAVIADESSAQSYIEQTAESSQSNTVAQIKDQSAASAASQAVISSQQNLPDYPINLNTCTIADLTTIKGIGEARADAIIQYREYLGGYTSVEQIKNIKGIGDSLYEKVAEYLTV